MSISVTMKHFCGGASQGVARHGDVGSGTAWLGRDALLIWGGATQGKAWQGDAWRGRARHRKAWRGRDNFDDWGGAGRGSAGRGKAGQGRARQGF
jgi:hypothetical protein